MKELEILSQSLNVFAGLSDEDFQLSLSYWHKKSYKKGDFFNRQKTVCKHMAFIIDGVFRSYVITKNTSEEQNIFFYSQYQILVPYSSFINQTPCEYHTQAMTDATVLYINLIDLNQLFVKSHAWEKVGRLLAQAAFNIAIYRMESFIFRTPEERYLDLIQHHPHIFNNVPLYQISSYLGIKGPSLSRIRKRISGK
jgi:CRP-like cAMP-binding protein